MDGGRNPQLIIVCQGPPRCDLMDEEAVAAQKAGCKWCKKIWIDEHGKEFVDEPGEA